MLFSLILFVSLAAFIFLLAKQTTIIIWAIIFSFLTLLLTQFASLNIFLQILLWSVEVILLACAIPFIRRNLITRHVFKQISRVMPSMSATEREAIAAGTVSWEADLFRGSPDLDKLHAIPISQLTQEEQAFIDGPVNELCRMVEDWKITHIDTDMPPEIWQFIKEKRFFGMIIPKEYGGLELSATAQAAILSRLYGRSVTVATTVSVPNSLGPAELLLKYGTQEQKNYYLPRLANGQEIPCFALTGPNAGSDAASIPDQGIVCRQIFEGKETVGIRLNWDKRYITLSPVATVLGLAFRLFDPDNLLGKGEDIGITCALIPTKTPGVVTGRRHFPLNAAFLNGPTKGKDVFIPLSYLIGGAEMAGSGWLMLMECLSAGRAVSLPSSACGGSQAVALATGAYARVRKQFNQPIAQFEGIEELLARIAGNTYLIDAGLMLATSIIDRGAKPAILGAILKYHTTERARQIANDAMDIHGGKGICLGPNNYLGRGYQNAPISITVEGANVLTRNLIIYGQGAMRCHPYLLDELESVRNQDLIAFDNAFWGHVRFFLANFTKSLVFSWTDACFIPVPKSKVKPYYQLICRYSTGLAFLSDFSMIILGQKLKRKESLSARLGDILSHLYLISAVLKRFDHEKEPITHLPIVDWCCQSLFYELEMAVQGIIENFPLWWARGLLKFILRPFGTKRAKPSDQLSSLLAKMMTCPNEGRSSLTRFVFLEALKNCPIGSLEEAFIKIDAVAALEKKVIRAAKEGKFTALTLLEQIDEAKNQGVLNNEEALELRDAELARQEVIAVDDFKDEELRRPQMNEKKKEKESLSTTSI